jgi:hypothetical protein
MLSFCRISSNLVLLIVSDAFLRSTKTIWVSILMSRYFPSSTFIGNIHHNMISLVKAILHISKYAFIMSA